MDMKEIIEKNEYLIKETYKREFDEFRRLLIEYNGRYNLTTILEERDMYYKHFLDSAIGSFLFKENASVIEIGSGAGFPSMVLKIIRPDLKLSLVESVGKKCEFLKVLVDNFQFKGVNIYNFRAEEGARRPELREKFDHATARAVARQNSLSEYCLPFVKVGGTFIAYKSGDKEELFEADSAYKALGGRRRDIYSYALPEGYGERTLCVIDKIKNTDKKYPRGQGKERKQPL